MGWNARFALLGATLGWLVGCSGQETLFLLDVARLESRSVEPGEALEFAGAGFPAGRSGTVVLSGVVREAGQAPREVVWLLGSVARSAERVSAMLDEATALEVDSHVSFTGSAELSFEVNERLAVAGRLERVVIEWMGEPKDHSALRAAGARMLESLGITVADSLSDPSLRVTELRAQSVAALGGIQVGDSIERVAGFPVRGVADVAQPSAADSVRLELRDAGGFVRAVELTLPEAGSWSVRYLWWVCPAALALLFLGPWPRPIAVVRAVAARLRSRRVLLFRGAEAIGAQSTRIDPWLVAASAAVCSLGAWQASQLSLTAALGAYLGLLVLRFWGFGRSTRADAQAGRSVAASLTLLCLALGCTAALSGGLGIAALALDQGTAPSGWNLFARPPVWLAAVVCFQCASRLHPATRCSRSHAWLDNLGRVILSAMFVAAFLGGPGWSLSAVPPSVNLGLSSALFAVKTVAVLWLSALLQPMASARLRTLAKAQLALLLFTTGWLWVMPDRALELRVGTAVLVTIALAATAALLDYAWGAWTRKRPHGAPTTTT